VTKDAEVLVLPQSQFHEIMWIYPQIGLNPLRIASLIFRQMNYTRLVSCPSNSLHGSLRSKPHESGLLL